MLGRLKFFDLRFKLLIVELIINKKITYNRIKHRIKSGGHGPGFEVFQKMYEAFELIDEDEFPLVKLNAAKYPNKK
jgi:hypothetical protein